MTMGTKRQAVLRAAAGVSVALLALSGCSSSNEDDASATTTASESSESTDETSGSETSESASETSESGSGGGDFDKAEAEGLLLTADELGTGYTEVPAEQISSALEQMGGGLTEALEQMTVEPVQCEAAMKKTMAQMTDLAGQMDQVAMAIFTQGTSSVSQSIAPQSVTGSTDDMKAQIGACQEMTLTIQGVSAKASMQPVELGLDADSVATLITMEVSAGGQNLTQTSASAYVTGEDNIMSISLNGDAVANEATLKEITTKAYEKAEPVL
ncbi:hypothetical protein [Blastococcus sp. Marseille-P5729]|uniref:hypothetical protein n=1 Tax=Blastococcus sp. Marseille-P5729 TaxID=2086582 RepID=UPI00131CA3D4|nr:hypothetical protein [Blastococcus sp. Marseille-P5729]